jgi:uncharacterized membrane protein
MLVHLLSILAFMAITFAAQGLSHFQVNKAHFEAIAHLRENPIMPMGLAAMIVQGLIMSLALGTWRGGDATLSNGVMLSLAFGLFLVSYVALAEPAKYTVPDIAAWIRIEVIVGAVQFVAFGVALGLIHARFG